MASITRTILIGFYLSRLSGTCVGQCFMKINKTMGCYTEAFLEEGVTSMLHCAYKCQRDDNCALFRYSETSKICEGCISYGAPSTGPVDTAIYWRTLTGSPYDDSDAACLTSCGTVQTPGCHDMMMFLIPSLNSTCFETCNVPYNFHYYADESEQYCLCGDKRQHAVVHCKRMCPIRGKCDTRKVYKYRYGC